MPQKAVGSPHQMRYLEDFLLHLRHGQGASEQTLRSYRTDLRQFAESLTPEERAHPESLGTPLLKEHLLELLLSGKSRATVARHAAALRCFFRFLLAEGFSTESPAASLRTPRHVRSLPTVLDRHQIERLLGAPKGSSFVALRDRALLETLYSAGLRVSELVTLDLPDVDLIEGLCIVLGKGRKERPAMLGSHAVKAMEDYLPARRSRLRSPEDPALFLNRLGSRLTTRSVRRSIARYLVAADLPLGVSPHTLRHSFATHLLHAGAGLKEVQEMLGHRQLSSTQIYTHVSPEHLRRVYEACHPRARHE